MLKKLGTLEDQYKALDWKPNDTTIPVSEIFYSIQGEGYWIGASRIFIRFGVCNLHCTWCDTRYTWDPEVMKREKEIGRIQFMTPQQIASEVINMIPFANTYRDPSIGVVFTGGEPMLHQQKIKQIISFLPNIHTEMETNGTISPESGLSINMYNVSPKLSNNGADEKKARVVPTVIKALLEEGRYSWSKEIPRAIFKFVITSPEDLQEAEIDYIKPFNIDKERVFMMPEGVTSDKLLETGRWLVQECMKKGYRYTPRLQVLTFGNKRGT